MLVASRVLHNNRVYSC